LPDEARREDVGSSSDTWGAWESAATTVLFSVPALLLLWKMRSGTVGPVTGGAFDELDWLIVGAALAGGMALSVAAGGLRAARLYVTTGLSTCLVWLLIGFVRRSTAPLAGVYRPLVFAGLAVHFNLLPLTLASAIARARAGLPGDIVSRLRQRTWGVAGAALGLDALPLVWWIAPAAWGRAVVFGWTGACVAAGGVLAALVVAEIASHTRTEGAEDA